MAYDLSVLDQGCQEMGHCPGRGTEAAVCGFFMSIL